MSDYQLRLERTDCRNAGPFYEMSGSHCPLGQPCDRCQWEREEALLRAALEACIDRLKWVSEDSESLGDIESCKPVIAQAEAALKSLNP